MTVRASLREFLLNLCRVVQPTHRLQNLQLQAAIDGGRA
jgi:hypothetical protein